MTLCLVAVLSAGCGGTADFLLEFGGIPTTVKRLTLVMDGLRSDDGHEYNMKLPLPLPAAAPTPAPTHRGSG